MPSFCGTVLKTLFLNEWQSALVIFTETFEVNQQDVCILLYILYPELYTLDCTRKGINKSMFVDKHVLRF